MTLETAQDFQALIETHRRDLQAHCYRMLGSLHDAEDLTQEALLRAWTKRDTFEGRASLKTWLHKIATNACLDALEQRRPRSLPAELARASTSDRAPGAPTGEDQWLTPAPAWVLMASEPGPEARYSAHESVALAFLTALQLLPPRQRAVLLLRDVLGWPAAEVADALDLTVAAANSALQRARETLSQPRALPAPADTALRPLLERYMLAWSEADLSGLVQLLHEEVTLAMPPLPGWYAGRDSVAAFLAQLLSSNVSGAARGRFRMCETSANGQPAVASYQRDPESGEYLPLGITLLDVVDERVRGLITFLDAALFPAFELPKTL